MNRLTSSHSLMKLAFGIREHKMNDYFLSWRRENVDGIHDDEVYDLKSKSMDHVFIEFLPLLNSHNSQTTSRTLSTVSSSPALITLKSNLIEEP